MMISMHTNKQIKNTSFDKYLREAQAPLIMHMHCTFVKYVQCREARIYPPNSMFPMIQDKLNSSLSRIIVILPRTVSWWAKCITLYPLDFFCHLLNYNIQVSYGNTNYSQNCSNLSPSL